MINGNCKTESARGENVVGGEPLDKNANGRKSEKGRNMNENTNATATAVDEVKSEYATLGAKVKKDLSLLPRVEYFRVDIDKGTGTAANWHETGYMLVVKLRGEKEMYLAGSVGAKFGMNIKSKYKTVEEARAAGFKMKKEWGRAKLSKTSKSTLAEKNEELAKKNAELAAQVAALQAQLAAA